eukprot:465569_1
MAYILFVLLIQCASSSNEYDMERTISDGAQRNTLAFGCLSFLTGSTCTDSFIPPGKVADYFGFQHYRDNTPNGMGHNSDFLTFCAFNVLEILNDAQIALISENAAAEVSMVHQYAYDRYPLLVAFRRQLEGDHSSHLSPFAVAQYSADPLYTVDANITIRRAYVFSKVIKSLDSTQQSLLDAMVSGGFSSWPKIYDTDKIDRDTFRGDVKQLIMTYCSELFSWYQGDTESDTYFAPERQANYFGSFYHKDAPVVNTRNYTIDEQLTADKGKYMLEHVLNDRQRPLLENLVDAQRDDLMGIVSTRRNISRQLRLYLNDGFDAVNDIDIDLVYELSKQYGRHDGQISYYYTMAFADVYDSLNSTQWDLMHLVRNLDDYPCEEQYIHLYAKKIDRPEIPNTDFLFGDEPQTSQTTTMTVDTTLLSEGPSTTQEPTTTAIDTTVLGPTCDEIVQYIKRYSNVAESPVLETFIEDFAQQFLATHSDCSGEDAADLEFYHWVSYRSRKQKVIAKGYFCCGEGKPRFGASYAMPESVKKYWNYEANDAWYVHNAGSFAMAQTEGKDVYTLTQKKASDGAGNAGNQEVIIVVVSLCGFMFIGCIVAALYGCNRNRRKPKVQYSATPQELDMESL